jgi:hypothetical protein
MYCDLRDTDKINAGRKDAASNVKCERSKSMEAALESDRAGDSGGYGKASPRMKSETPIAPIAPVSTV